MQWSRRVRAVVHISLWVILLTALLCVSTPKIFRSASKYSIRLVGPFHSSNSFLYFASGTTDGSERLIALFDSLPSSKTILIFVRNDDPRSSFLGMMTAYLAWPHPVWIVDVMGAGLGNGSGRNGSVAAVVYCRLKRPSSVAQGERFGEALEVVPIAAVAER